MHVTRNLLLSILPDTALGDRLFAFVKFIRAHRRLPTRRMLLNDVLYSMKVEGELRNPLRVFVSDKLLVKLYVKAVLGDQFNVPTIAVLGSPEEVRKFEFPSECCVKPTHLSGKVAFNSAGAELDLDVLIAWLGQNHYRQTREANYKYLKPAIIVEPILFDDQNVMDYKIFCYRGYPKLVQVDLDRRDDHVRLFYDVAWNVLPFSMMYPRASHQIACPNNFTDLLAAAAKLSSSFNLVRIDMYTNGQQSYVGEITNCPEGAEGNFLPPSGELTASKLIFD